MHAALPNPTGLPAGKSSFSTTYPFPLQREFLVIRGESGSGKSTLLTILSGLDRPDAGRVLIKNRDITDLDEDQLAPFRNKPFGFIFQSFYLIPSLAVLENVMFSAELCGDQRGRERAEKLLSRVGLSGRSDSLPRQPGSSLPTVRRSPRERIGL